MVIFDLFPIPCVLCGVAAPCTRVGRRIVNTAARLADYFATRPAIAMSLIFLVALGAYAGWSFAIHYPLPSIHDEMSYLLAADTFVHGRLANPTHPMWKHLESIHVIQTPTYVSKFPAGQGMALALGQVTVHRPIAGVWLIGAIACAAIYWMLLAWTRPRWALLGTVLLGCNPQVFAWTQNYWGGSLALLGGALTIGALPRICRRPAIMPAIVLACGVIIMAFSRPFEGTLLALPVLLVVAGRWALRKYRNDFKSYFKRVVAPILIVGSIGLCMMGYYNWRTTGNPAVMPYMVHVRQYMIVPLFLFGKPNTTHQYRFPEFQQLHGGWEMDMYRASRRNEIEYAKAKFTSVAMHFHGKFVALAFVLIALPFVIWRDRRLQFAVLASLFVILGGAVEMTIEPHYMAPAISVATVTILICMRYLKVWQRGRRVGQILVWGVVTISLFAYVPGYRDLARPPLDPERYAETRQQIVDRLDKMPGEHLILVHTLPEHGLSEWVYNRADIDHAKVVWAHDMGPAENQELLDYFKGRTVWLLPVGNKPPVLEPYAQGENSEDTTRATTRP